MKEVNSVSSHGCYVPYSMDRQRVYVMSLGGNRAYGPGKQSEGFQYKPGLEFNSFSMFSGTSFYDRSSFAIELSNMREKARLEIWRLRDQIHYLNICDWPLSCHPGKHKGATVTFYPHHHC